MAKFVQVPESTGTSVEMLKVVQGGDGDVAATFTVGLIALFIVAAVGFMAFGGRTR